MPADIQIRETPNISELEDGSLKDESLKNEQFVDELVEGLGRILPQLSKAELSVNRESLLKMLSSKDCVIFTAHTPTSIVGCLTLIFYHTLTGKMARIEDVVVDEAYRGQGIGSQLNAAAIDRARQAGAKAVDLTSKPSRTAANAMYKKLGFELRETNVYRYQMPG